MRFADTTWIVEADSFARLALWSDFSTGSVRPISTKSTIRWEQDSAGFSTNVGTLLTISGEELPVMCDVFFAKLNGWRVAFYTSSSRAMDREMVEEWIRSQCPDAGRCDAMNFSHCVHEILHLTTVAEVQES